MDTQEIRSAEIREFKVQALRACRVTKEGRLGHLGEADRISHRFALKGKNLRADTNK